MDNRNFNITEINRSLQESFIHYDPQRIDYTVNNIELELLEQQGSNIWKDVFLAGTGLGIPSIVNGCCDYSKLNTPKILTTDIFLNFLIGGIAVIVSLICLFVWRKNNKSFNNLIQQIKNKPKYRLPNS